MKHPQIYSSYYAAHNRYAAHSFLVAALCLMMVFIAPARMLSATDQPPQQKVPNFLATLVNFQTSTGGPSHNVKLVTATIRFTNTAKKPIILGYLHGSASADDDQGNRYLIGRDIYSRGLGEIVGSQVDPKFILQPGESANAMFDLYWMAPSRAIWGTRYTLNLTVREIASVNGVQYRLGAEHALEFRGLADHAWPSTGDVIPAAYTGPMADTEGPFSAQVTELRVSKSNSGNNPKHVLTVTIQFKNLTDKPLILAYEGKSGLYIDNIGNRYDKDAETGHTAMGIGTTLGSKADPSFVLQPGEAQEAKFQLWRYITGKTQEIGTRDTFYAAVQQLEILPSQQIRNVRQYSLTFPDLTASDGGDMTNNGIITPSPRRGQTPNPLKKLLGDLLHKR